MRLLLDEMYPATIAEGLRARGHDAVAVVERPEFRNLSDDALFAAAQDEGRAVVTENVADFALIANEWDARAEPHHGIVFVHPAKHPRAAARTVGAMVNALDDLVARRAAAQPESLRLWL